MTYTKKFKTPLLRPMRTKCGTMYTFSSALEDVGLNINERNNVVKLSNYAVLNIPTSKSTSSVGSGYDSDINDYKSNNFNFHNILGNYAYINGLVAANQGFKTLDGKSAIPLSFQSYALNLETAILTSEEYDPTTSLTVSERVFWKWLKESGAIRWTKEGNDIVEEERTNGDSEYDYNTVVQAIGDITAGAFKLNSFGNFNEVLIQLPTSFGDTPVKFKQVEDENYFFSQQVPIIDENPNLVIGQSVDDGDGLPKVAFYDYINSETSVTKNQTNGNSNLYYNLVNGVENESGKTAGWWYTAQDNSPEKSNSYVMDVKIDSDFPYENVHLQIGDKRLYRSNYDCMSIDFDMKSYSEYNVKSFDELASRLSASGYEFNAIMIYYTVYNSTGETKLATNLLGVLFLDGAVGAISSELQDINGEIFIPTLEKCKSNSIDNNGKYISEFGNSYNFRINIQSNNLKDDTAAYIEDSTSINYLDDFTKVYGNLNQAINILGKHTKTIDYVTNQYIDINNRLDIQSKTISMLSTNINSIIDKLNIDILGSKAPTIKIGKNIANDATESGNSTVVGYNACYNTKALINSVAFGTYAGYNCEENVNNVFIGYKAGYYERDTYKLHIESNEDYSKTPLIGGDFKQRTITLNPTKMYIPNLERVGSGIALTWDNGEVKLATSSIRYKEAVSYDIQSNVLDLEPCKFIYKQDTSKTLQYGLIAEDVYKIDPTLVVYDNDGAPNGVKYDMLSVLLLKEVKRLNDEVERLKSC